MDRTVVLEGAVEIAQGHRVEVVEGAAPGADAGVNTGADAGAVRVCALIDLDSGIEYRFGESAPSSVTTWTGRVRRSTVTYATDGDRRTELLIDPISPAATSAKTALHGADAAAEAARVEAGRWGGSDRVAPEEPERFW